MLACGQRALAHVSYLESTRAKAQLNRDQTDQFYTGNLASFAPGLTPPATSSEVLLAISFEDIAAVDTILDAVAAFDGAPDINAKQDYGWMYSRSFADPDGHVWECMWMDMAASGEQEAIS